MSDNEKNLKFLDSHEWAGDDDGVVTVGISNHAQELFGDIVYVEVDTLDETLQKEEVFGTVEAVKTVSDLFLPLSGEILEFNESLETNPEKVNEDPYNEGWMIKMNMINMNNSFLLFSISKQSFCLINFECQGLFDKNRI